MFRLLSLSGDSMRRISTTWGLQEIPAEEEAQIKKLREDRVGQCGWASDNRRPYRPLGTPDLERRDPYRCLSISHAPFFCFLWHQ